MPENELSPKKPKGQRARDNRTLLGAYAIAFIALLVLGLIFAALLLNFGK